MRTATRVLLLSFLLAAAAACGGSPGASSPGAPAGSTTVTAVDFQFRPRAISVTSGKVVFFLVNNGPSAHDMVVADSTGKAVARSSLVQSGDTFTFTIDNLPPGTYIFYCDVPGHREAGMQGTLTVT
ncbi:MAG TPA: plastocyanin/azurin family copper-binding protein [Solirubrobacterales bacterium]|nr:plastocyanin/azurin family copper-binding protein [Solirubrobacterales bacterium]